MTSNVLRAPLIQSAIFLGVVSLLVYLTATSPEGTLWSSLGTLFIAIFRLVQLTIGLVVAVLFCLAVLIGIFLGCVAMVSRENAASMVEMLRRQVSDKLLFVRALVIRDVPARGTRALQEHGEAFKKEMQRVMDDSFALLRNEHAAALGRIEEFTRRIDDVEARAEMESMMKQQLGRQDELIQGASAALGAVQQQVAQLQERVDDLSTQMSSKLSDKSLAELTSKLVELDQSNIQLQNEMLRLKQGRKAGKKSSENNSLTEEVPVAHRLFAHLQDKGMQEKIEGLVTETLDTDMSYAKVIEHLVRKTKGKTAEVIAAHPSLAKEYIRFRRNNQ